MQDSTVLLEHNYKLVVGLEVNSITNHTQDQSGDDCNEALLKRSLLLTPSLCPHLLTVNPTPSHVSKKDAKEKPQDCGYIVRRRHGKRMIHFDSDEDAI